MDVLGAMDRALSSHQKIEQFLTGSACDGDVSASTQNHAFNAFQFSFR